jgi:tetratricopeptide (TPR) repeat protein
MAAGVAAAAWPFWAMFALALTSVRRQPSADDEAVLACRMPLLRPAFVMAGVGSLVVMVLTVNPMRAIWLMSQAKSEFESSRAIRAEQPLQRAAAADGLDPAPRAALAEFYRRMAGANREQAAGYLGRAVKSAREAVRANPASHTLLHDLAWTLAQYSSAARDTAAAQEAVAAMRNAVDLYPNWPRGHLQLGMLLAGAGERTSNGGALLRDAVAEFDTAMRLNERWPADDPNKFDAKDLAALRARRQQVLDQLQAVASSQPTTPGSQ